VNRTTKGEWRREGAGGWVGMVYLNYLLMHPIGVQQVSYERKFYLLLGYKVTQMHFLRLNWSAMPQSRLEYIQFSFEHSGKFGFRSQFHCRRDDGGDT